MVVNPIWRVLVPERSRVAPEGFTPANATMQRGLPHSIGLSADRRLLIVAPTGVVTQWRDAAGDLLVSSAADDDAPRNPAADVPRDYGKLAPVTALLQINNQTVAAAPLKAGVRLRLPESGRDAVAIELVILDWAIYAGTLRGAGAFGSFVSLAWRNADVAVNQFSAPPPNPVFLQRQPSSQRLQSETGRDKPVRNPRFNLKRSVLA